jgi:molecular chaperone DnaJ
MADYYKILDVSKDASDDEIKKAYRKMAHKYHPDKAGGDEKKFKEISEAYQVLSDKTKRSQYDQFGQTFDGGNFGGSGGFSAKGGPASGWDFGDIFSNFGGQGGFSQDSGSSGWEDIFGNIFGGGGGKGRAERGSDIQVDIEITFEEMVRGAKKSVNLYKGVECDRCGGTGGEPGMKMKTCPTCKGSGQVRRTTRSFLGSFSQVSVCHECSGAGKIFEKKCKKCGGDGRVKEQKEIEINIPSGIENGQTIVMRGAGEVGAKGAGAGDLYILVRVEEHKKFNRDGADILSSETIKFSLAALGGETQIDTIDGKLILKIPSGTQSGETFRVRERGIIDSRTGRRGNHLVKIIVEIPKKLNRKQKELVKELGELGE